jgi:hypothetical protein
MDMLSQYVAQVNDVNVSVIEARIFVQADSLHQEGQLV